MIFIYVFGKALEGPAGRHTKRAVNQEIYF